MAHVTHVRSKSDSPSKTCTEDDCERPMRARGLCSTHYNQANPRQVEVPCAQCGTITVKEPGSKYANRFCSLSCRDTWRFWNDDGVKACPVPPMHPSRTAVACLRCGDLVTRAGAVYCTRRCATRAKQAKKSQARSAARAAARSACSRPAFVAGYCADCRLSYVIASEWVTHSRYCSDACARRTVRRARRAAERGASGSFTWDDFMKLTMQLGNCCAYCGGNNNGQPFEPDHVRPLSRDGHNGLTNILPSCRRCNGDKRDLLVHEWATDRKNRGLPPVRYDVERFAHLVAHRYDAA